MMAKQFNYFDFEKNYKAFIRGLLPLRRSQVGKFTGTGVVYDSVYSMVLATASLPRYLSPSNFYRHELSRSVHRSGGTERLRRRRDLDCERLDPWGSNISKKDSDEETEEKRNPIRFRFAE